MMDNKSVSRKWLYTAALAVIIVLQCLMSVYFFTVRKTAYHEDEYFSYALSNSFYRPFLYGNAHQSIENTDSWFTGSDFRDYIRTNEQTRFRYDSVWYNQSKDVHPPLYYTILHTICSVKTGSFSWWYAFVINLVFFAAAQVFLYRLSALLTRSRLTALLVSAFWGFTLSAQGSLIFLRMYTMLTAFTVMYAYFSLRLTVTEAPRPGDFAAAAVTALLGALTQHLFLIMAFLITLLSCLCLLMKKRVKHCLLYGTSAAVGVAVSFAAFPEALSRLTGTGMQHGETPDIPLQSRLLSYLLLHSLTGTDYISLGWVTYVIGALGVLVPISIPLLFLFRKEPWFTSLIKRIMDKLRTHKKSRRGLRTIYPALVLLISCIAFHLILSGTIYYYDFLDDSERYEYLLTPFIVLLAVWLVGSIMRRLRKKSLRTALNGIFAASLAALIVFQHSTGLPHFVLDADMDNGRLSQFTAESDCIFIGISPVYLPCFCNMLEEADNVYFTELGDSHYREEQQAAEYRKLYSTGERFVLLIDATTLSREEDRDSDDLFKRLAFNEEMTESFILSWFEEDSGRKAEYLGRETTHDNTIHAYRFT